MAENPLIDGNIKNWSIEGKRKSHSHRFNFVMKIDGTDVLVRYSEAKIGEFLCEKCHKRFDGIFRTSTKHTTFWLCRDCMFKELGKEFKRKFTIEAI